MVNRGQRFLILLFGALFFAEIGVAAQFLEIEMRTRVYSKRSKRAKVIKILQAGDRVPISKRKYGRWKKVLIWVGGRRKSGYVRSKDVERFEIVTKSRKTKKVSSYHGKYGIGIKTSFTYTSQGSRSLDLNPLVEISALSGASTFFGFFADIPINPKYVIRPFLNLRKTDMSGTADSAGNEDPLKLNHKMLSFGATLKMYSGSDSDFWWGATGEFAKVNDASLVLADSNQLINDKDSFPSFYIGQLSIGYDFHLAGPVYTILDLNVGAIINAKPVIIVGDIGTSFSFSF